MAEWELTKNVVSLREQFNKRFPQRSTKSDGTIGNSAHADEISGHNPDRSGNAEYKDGDSRNEVRAIDITAELNDRYGITMTDVIESMLHQARYDRNFPFRYMIYNGWIYKRGNLWQRERYTGANKHDKHAHFSGDYSQTADNNSSYIYDFTRLGIPSMDAADVWEYNLDPQGKDYQAKGVVNTIFLRTSDLQKKLAELNAKIDGISETLDDLVNRLPKA
jgi:antitoxin component of RelBE/YafQ-DinJ toxin-antitoxin module